MLVFPAPHDPLIKHLCVVLIEVEQKRRIFRVKRSRLLMFLRSGEAAFLRPRAA